MKLHELIDVPELDKLVEDGYVSARPHPTLPLKVLNYTPKAVEIKEWSNTLSYCRGLVYDILTGDVVAIPFKKFWNYGDSKTGELPTNEPRVYEKLDGSLGVGFFYKGEFIIATRGSFESEQAKWANIWAKRFGKPETDFSENYTYLFEIVWEEDKKVVDYTYSGLVLLGSVSLIHGLEFTPEDTFAVESTWMKDVRLPKKYAYEELEELQKKEIDNFEGWVVVWYGTETKRVKIKLAQYCLLHRMYFQTTAEVIWEMVKNGELKEKTMYQILEGADKKLQDWAQNIAFNIALNYVEVQRQSKKDFRECIELTNILHDLEAPEKERRKAFAMYASQRSNPSLLFTLYDGKMVQYEDQLWKLAKPENSRFRDQGEEE